MVKVLFFFMVGISSFNSYGDRFFIVKDSAKKEGFFVTDRNRSLKVYDGMPALMSTEEVTVKVKVVNFTKDDIQWELFSKSIEVPFSKGDTIMFQNYSKLLVRQQRFYGQENLQKLIKKRKKIKDEVLEKKMHGLTFKFGLGSDISSTHTLFSNDEIGSSTDLFFAFSYFIPLSPGIYFSPGISYTVGELVVDSESNTTKKTEFSAEFVFQLARLRSFSDSIPYFGLGVGAGVSETDFPTRTTKGHVIAIPKLTSGLFVPFEGTQHGVGVELNLDGLSIREEEGGVNNDSNKVNLKLALGYLLFY